MLSNLEVIPGLADLWIFGLPSGKYPFFLQIQYFEAVENHHTTCIITLQVHIFVAKYKQ